MKKIIFYTISVILFLGCANKVKTDTIDNKSVELLTKYGIDENFLIKKDSFYFYILQTPNGFKIVKFDKNYNLIWQKPFKHPINIVKTKIKDNIYVLGYDEVKNRVVFLTFDFNGNLKNKKHYGKKYNVARDFIIINNTPFIAITHYNNNKSDIIVYGKKTIKVTSNQKKDVSFIKKFNSNLLIVGTVFNKNEDVLIVYKSLDDKLIWKKVIDFRMDERVLNVNIKDDIIAIGVISTDSMGEEKKYLIKIDKNGKIIEIKKDMELKKLPHHFRT